MSMSSPSKAITIFISYAITSKKDIKAFDELIKHLSILFSHYPTLQCYDSRLSDKSPTTQFNEAHLNQADLIILLTSADFFASKQQDMQQALALREAGSAHVVSVQLRPTDWGSSILSHYLPLPSNNKPVSSWSDRDAAFKDVAQGIRQIVEEIASQRTLSPHINPRSVLLYDPPDAYNNLFTDRETILEDVSSFFIAAHSDRTAILALSGLGGVGKTSIAKEYCTHANIYQDILWLNASSRSMLSTYVSVLVDRLSLPNAVREDEQQFFASIKQWLQEQSRWLLVLDQIEDMTLVDLIIPRYSSGHVLLTTQLQDTKKRAFSLLIPSMDIDAGALFLLRRIQIRTDLVSLEQVSAQVVREARDIAQAMDGFPLALDQAGAYLEEKGGDLTSYLTLYEQHRPRLLSERGQAADDHYASVIGTLAPRLDSLKHTPHMDLLLLLAFLRPDAIPEGLLMNGAQVLHEPLRSLVADPLILHMALGKLRNFSLVHYQAGRRALQIQRIVQDVLIDRLTREQQRYWAQEAVRMINRAFPEVRFDTRAVCECYLPQAEHCYTLITKFDLTLKEGAILLERLGSFCFQRASYDEAKTYLTQALHLYERTHHRRVDMLHMAQTLNSLGLLYRQQAHYQEAAVFHQRALELRERVSGPDDPKTMESLHNIAMIYGDLGRYQKAEQIYLRVLTIEERTKGLEHPDVADTLNELGLTYTQQGRFTEAEAAYRRALTIYEHTRNADHLDLTYPLDGLGALSELRGNYQQAETLYQQAFVICMHAFGELHPDTAHSINTLAGVATSQGNYQHAEILYQQALSISEQMLGPRHPDVALVLNDQALLATKQGQYKIAEPLYQRALSIYELILGSKHPTVASVLNNLGQLSRMLGDKQQAEKLLRRALFIREQALDPTHPSIAQSLSNLADLLAEQNKYEEAKSLFQRAFVLYLQIVGPKHPDVAHVPEKYASLLEGINSSEEGAIVRSLVRQQEETLSIESPKDDS